MKKKIFAVLALAFLLALSMAPAAWAATVASGLSGDISWQLNSEGNLEIYKYEGQINAAMPDYTLETQPWAAYRDDITVVTVYNGVKVIGKNAFAGCNNLYMVSIPATVNSIGGNEVSGVFSGCPNLKEIMVSSSNSDFSTENGVLFNKDKTILLRCPIGKTGIYAVPDTVTTINHNAFSKCNQLTSVKLPISCTMINQSAFYDCRNLENINFPEGFMGFSRTVFANCYKLADITVPATITRIYGSAFGASGLKNINYLGSRAEWAKIDVMDTVDDVLKNVNISFASEDFSSYEKVAVSGGYMYFDKATGIIVGCDDTVTSVVIPKSIDDVPVTQIGNHVFYNCSNLRYLTMHKGIKSIGLQSLGTNSNLDITYEGSEKELSTLLSKSGYSLDDLFGYSYDYTDYPEPELLYPVVGGNIYFIKATNTITGCDVGVTVADIPSEIKGTAVKYIAPFAFTDKENLTKIILPEGLLEIGDFCFNGCNNLVSVSIPASVEKIYIGALSGCPKLTEVLLNTNNDNYCIENGVLFDKDKTTLIQYFDANTNKIYVVPDSVFIIESAFMADALNEIYIPKSVVECAFPETMFVWAKNLTDMYYEGTEEDWLKIKNAESNVPENVQIHYNSTMPEQPTNIPVTGVTLDKTALNLEVGGTATLTATVVPANATNKNIMFISSNAKVATVDKDGKVTAVGKGAAIITATAGDKKATCAVTVTADKVYTITFDTDGGTLAEGITNPDYVIKGETYKMPGASKSRYTLKAWAIGSKDSQTQAKANDVYTFTEDTTVYAIWQYNGGGGGSHGGSSRPSGTTTTKPGTTEKPGDTNKPGTTTDNNKTVTAANVNNKFADVQNNAWYSEAIAYVYNKGIMNGTNAGKFEPNATTTRAMLVTMLHRLAGGPQGGVLKFNDVASGQWFSEAIAWAAASGVVNGYENGTFAPNAAITREQLAVILWRYVGSPAASAELNFSDAATVSDWAQQAMQWAVSTGIINGDNGALRPAGNATRAEVAMMLMRFCENISGK